MNRFIKILFGSLSVFVAFIAIGLGYLKSNDVYRQKFFAGVLNQLVDVNDAKMMDIRCNQVLKHFDVKGDVLEIGSGTGINFPCLYNNTNIQSYTGIEPNTHMYSYFNDFIKKYQTQFSIRLLPNSATDMQEIESNSIDTIIMTLVLCSIPDPLPEKVLLEAHRVLKPGGSFLFFEHIEANPQNNPLVYRTQRLIEPVWSIISDGCQFKQTSSYFDAMKTVYSTVEYQHRTMPIPLFFVKDAIIGKMIK